MHIFLDDIRYPSEVTWINLPVTKWRIVRSYNEFIETIEENGIPEFVTFDHDLGDFYDETGGLSSIEKTGYDCAKWLVDYCIDNSCKFPNFMVHSKNNVGAENISAYINNFIQKG